MSNRQQRRAQKRAMKGADAPKPLPRIADAARVKVARVFDELVEVADPRYEPARDGDGMTRLVVGLIEQLTDDELVVLESTAEAIVQLATSQMQVRLIKSLGEALAEGAAERGA